MTVVVSPLIALMRDQAEKLTALGLDAVEVNSAIPAADNTCDNCRGESIRPEAVAVGAA